MTFNVCWFNLRILTQQIMSSTAETVNVGVGSFSKRVIKNKSCRKRQQSSEEEGSDEPETNVVKKVKKVKQNFLSKTTKKDVKKNENSSGDESLDENDMRSIMVSYKSTREAQRSGPSDMGATAVLETETETDKDAQAIFENSIKINKELKGRCSVFVVIMLFWWFCWKTNIIF